MNSKNARMGAGGAVVSSNGQEPQVGPIVDVTACMTLTRLHADRSTRSRQQTQKETCMQFCTLDACLRTHGTAFTAIYQDLTRSKAALQPVE